MTPYVLKNGHMGDAQAKISDLFTEVHELERQLEECKDSLDGSEITHAATLADLRDCKRELAAERALADRLAEILEDIRHFYGIAECAKQPVTEALAAWKEARDEA